MSDDEPPEFPPPKKRKPRLTVVVPSGMPPAEEIKGDEREALALWMRERIEAIERAHAERVEVLRTVGEHPSPIFQRIVMMDGALGMPKSLLAKKLGISVGTLMQHYGDDYELGKAEALSKVAANALRIAQSLTDPNAARVAMQILERRFGEEWRPPSQKLEVDDKRDKVPVIDASSLTFEEREQMRQMLKRITSGGEGEPIRPGEDEPVIP